MDKTAAKFLNAIKKPIYFVAFLWVFHLWKVFVSDGLWRFGIFPRDFYGLKGIITAPLSHGDFQHLISNSLPLLALMTILFFFYRRIAWPSFVSIYLMTGFAVWVIARPVYHIGASGIVYGLVSFIFWLGVFRRNVKSIVLSLTIVIMYSGMFYGVLPNQEGISWESHLFGGIVGIIIAFLFRSMIERDEVIQDPWADEIESEEYFLSRDTFDLTMWERQQMDNTDYTS